jgi:ABC-type cobalamin transport system permease subunit
MRSTVIAVAIRLAISASLAVSGVIHAYLYVNGYRDIPMIGPGVSGQAIVFCVLALLILAGRNPRRNRPRPPESAA